MERILKSASTAAPLIPAFRTEEMYAGGSTALFKISLVTRIVTIIIVIIFPKKLSPIDITPEAVWRSYRRQQRRLQGGCRLGPGDGPGPANRHVRAGGVAERGGHHVKKGKAKKGLLFCKKEAKNFCERCRGV